MLPVTSNPFKECGLASSKENQDYFVGKRVTVCQQKYHTDSLFSVKSPSPPPFLHNIDLESSPFIQVP